MDLAAEDPDFLSRFMKEGQLAGQLNHKNIVRIYDAGMEGNRAFIAMEFIEGCDTLELLESRGALPPDEVLALAIAIGEALQEAHSLGIIHRDIKPDNILATHDGRIKLADLGLAKQLNDDFGSTMAGTALGTPYYISPEQALDAMKADARSDIYSLGATLYHLLSGVLPYEGDNVMGVMLKHANEPLVPPQDKTPGLPESFCRVICKMMAKYPDERYQSCTALLDDLFKLKYGNEDVAHSNREVETKLPEKLASSKSVRVKVKIPAGKYAHKNPVKTQRNLKKRTGVNKNSESTSKRSGKGAFRLVAALVLVLFFTILAFALPSKESSPKVGLNIEKQTKEKPIVKKASLAPTEKVVKPTSKTPQPQKIVDFLASEDGRYFQYMKSEYASFKGGRLYLKGEAEKAEGILKTKDIYSNYKLDIEFKWLSEKSDSGIEIHCGKGRHYEINMANNWAATGTLHTRALSFNHDGETKDYFKVEKNLTRTLNTWHTLSILCKEDTLTVTVNGTELYSFDSLTTSQGYIKMGLWKNLDIEIRKFAITSLD